MAVGNFSSPVLQRVEMPRSESKDTALANLTIPALPQTRRSGERKSCISLLIYAYIMTPPMHQHDY